MSLVIEVSGRTVDLGNPDKVMFPDPGITKRDLADYHLRIADTMLPHVRARPLTMHRFPDGIDGNDFYQKDVPDHFPDWIRTETVEKENGTVTHVVCDDAATLAYLVDQACITPHVWLSTVDDLDSPDRLVFDLDPPATRGSLAHIRDAARAIRDLMADLGVGTRLMTTGSAGFHVVVPLATDRSFDEVRDFARSCAELLAHRHPDLLTLEQRRSERAGRIFLDYLRNAYAQTTVAPYAVRARPGAPVATPIDWEELRKTEPQSYTVENLFRRMGQKDDPWAVDGIGPQSLDQASARLADLRS